jgi:hypothetical protein
MRKLRNKKRMTTLLVGLLLTLVVGSAFALTPGTLEIHGFINVAAQELDVRWCGWNTSVTGDTIVAAPNVFADAAGRPNQRIQWMVSFGSNFAQQDWDTDIDTDWYYGIDSYHAIVPSVDWGLFWSFDNAAMLIASVCNYSPVDVLITELQTGVYVYGGWDGSYTYWVSGADLGLSVVIMEDNLDGVIIPANTVGGGHVALAVTWDRDVFTTFIANNPDLVAPFHANFWLGFDYVAA